MSQAALEQIVLELNRIANLLDNYLVVPDVPMALEHKLGKEAITYLNEDELIREEEEQFRLVNRGLTRTQSED